MNTRRNSSLIPHPSSLAFALVAFFVASAALALDVHPPPTRWFTDNAGIVDSAQAEALNAKLRNFEQRSGAQFLIYIFPTLDGEALEDFTIRCAEKWKVGNKKYDNGLILFVFVKERKIRIEVGYGLEPTITDAFSSDIIRNVIAPRFKQGDYYGGLNAAADAIIARIEQKEAPVAPVQKSTGSAKPGGVDVIGLLVFLFILFFVILPLIRRGGGCGGCFWPMFFMGGGRGSTFGGGWGGGGGGGFGGFSGGGGSFGGGGASGGW